jgi:hypothetical protein
MLSSLGCLWGKHETAVTGAGKDKSAGPLRRSKLIARRTSRYQHLMSHPRDFVNERILVASMALAGVLLNLGAAAVLPGSDCQCA